LARPEGRTRSALFSLVVLAALALFGCAGGQSGAEDCLGTSNDRAFNAEAIDDEDGGVDDDDDGGPPASIMSDTGPEALDGPSSCPPPDDEN
jgi:hypothetical protein